MSKLLTREQAAKYIGIDPKTFDRVFRQNPNFKRFSLGPHSERFTTASIDEFISTNDLPQKNLKRPNISDKFV